MKNKINWPRITIVTPSFNQGKFLEETIQSILNQNYPNLEYFIIDGGSTDNSVDIIKKYEDKIDWWVSEKDAGQSDALCKGFERATGELLGWLNSDDLYFPSVLFKIGEIYDRDPDACIYAGGIAIGEMGTGKIKKCSCPISPRKIFSRHGLLGFGQPSMFFKSEDYRQIGGLRKDLHIRMDGDIMFRLIQHNPKVVIVDEVISFFRVHETSKSMIAVTRYIEETDDFLKSINLSKLRLATLKIFYKIYKMSIGGYFQSYLVTYRYKGKSMSEIWASSNLQP